MIETLAQFGLADAADIAIVTTLLYAGVSLLRRTQAALVALGIAFVGALYLTSSLLGLGLSTHVLQLFFATTGLALVVIFQDELRQAFEELAAWAIGRQSDHRPRLDSVDVLVESLSRLAREKVGALVVLSGLQKLDRHVHGGHDLGGRLSTPLLESVFDASSAGHDGAVIVEDRHVSRFGVQLPLSKNLQLLTGRGTRHSAALGLSERTDALCLVASEERGTISAAAHGNLREIRDEEELASLISHFYRQRRSLVAPRPLLVRVFQDHWVEKSAAFGAALALWLLMKVSASG